MRAISQHPEHSSIDPDEARRQHGDFVDLLSRLGAEVIELPVTEDFPDSCFTADVGVVIRRKALLGRMAHPGRQGEELRVENELRQVAESIERVSEQATLEGGDVLLIGDKVIAGRSTRTNEAGIDELNKFLDRLSIRQETASVPSNTLHLQTAASRLDDRSVIGREDVLEQSAFDEFEKVYTEPDEPEACNVVALGKDVILSADCPKAIRALDRAGFRPHGLDLSEFFKADGGPSCLILRVD